jgi:hypothetical protein
MTPLFPRETGTWTVIEPSAVRAFTMSVVGMAVLTGVIVRLVRMLALTYGPRGGWLYLGGAIAAAVVIFYGMATLHLGNFTVRRWLWRVPAFGLIEAAAEMVTSAILLAFGLERHGTVSATFREWPRMAAETFIIRPTLLILFALILAGVVTLVRIMLVRRGAVTETTDAWEADEGR